MARFFTLGCLLLLPMSAVRADPPKRLEFNRMVAHWSDYADPGYLKFIEDAKPQLVQVGFYGAHFYSLAHTPHGKGYPAHFPVMGLREGGDWLAKLNKELHGHNVKVVGHFNVEFLVGDPDGKEVRIEKAMIDERNVIPLSPMPSNFAETIGADDLNHLMAYLLAQRGKS